MNCPNCGGVLKSNERYCSYCGSENPNFISRYSGLNFPAIKIEKIGSNVKRYCGEISIPEMIFRLDSEQKQNAIKKQIALDLASVIVDDMKLYRADMIDLDPMTQTIKLRYTIKIMED